MFLNKGKNIQIICSLTIDGEFLNAPSLVKCWGTSTKYCNVDRATGNSTANLISPSIISLEL